MCQNKNYDIFLIGEENSGALRHNAIVNTKDKTFYATRTFLFNTTGGDKECN
jgi:hypothetical protein